MATGDLHKKIREDQSSSSRNMFMDRQTDRHTDRQDDHNTPHSLYRGRVINPGLLLDVFY